jgi:hypothetical protein
MNSKAAEENGADLIGLCTNALFRHNTHLDLLDASANTFDQEKKFI